MNTSQANGNIEMIPVDKSIINIDPYTGACAPLFVDRLTDCRADMMSLRFHDTVYYAQCFSAIHI